VLASSRRRGGTAAWQLQLKRFRVHNSDERVPFEILKIKGQKSAHPVDRHRRDHPCVMNLYSGNAMLKDEFAPFRKDIRRLRQQSNKALETVDISSRLFWGKAESVCIGWPGGRVPELNQVLRKTNKHFSLMVAPSPRVWKRFETLD